jgi:SAM-dependent methyltransferase
MLYDDQAATFDQRAGVPAEAVEKIADVAAEIAGLRSGQRWLEVGAGTGLLSLPLLGRGAAYTGFDRSPAMLEAFRARLAASGLAAALHVADGEGRWPAEDGSADVVFGARAIHHLDPAHAAAEVRRVLGPAGGWLLVGRVRRPDDSPKARMRRLMRAVLREHGHHGRSHEARADAVFAALAGGGRSDRRVEAAAWTIRHAPADSLRSWQEKEGLAGIALDAPTKERVLAELGARARAAFGDPERPLPQEERFELRAISVAID